MRSSAVSASRSWPALPQRRLSAPSGSTLAATTSFTMACAKSAVAEAGLASTGTEAGIVFQRTDAAVDVDRRVRFRVAGIGDGDRFIACAVGGEHVGDRADE